ncbi:uncharacterized protein BO97DRAFT_469716 [Aspergillus homomorphus CBS 101889]|uniref:Uncharacterized protein n=1 Tax=Aspergillus homomorphus (strain CBS 101889) TaxID=1450537 RepID=A0A395I4M0_ASPHC|nr:hypothetical protein BO97DRAFT_469716 [Aspergillus homomorphus CBS 101889]RAL13324.1 hypothetical protein BO97DRAFT_469716 [Aspergillus homomorphus CBS 101889]
MDPSVSPPSHPVASDQVTMAAAVQNLAASIKTLITLIDQESDRRDPQRDRDRARQNDPILNALNEEIESGRPETLPASSTVQLMPDEEIDAKNKAHMSKYTAWWEECESTSVEKQAMETAYVIAFDRFPTIYRVLGWHGNEDILFTGDVLSRYRDSLLEGLFAIEPYRMKRIFGPLEPSRAAFESSRLPRLLSILVHLEARRNDALECRDGKCVDCRYFDADQTLRGLIEVGRTSRLSRIDGPNEMTLQQILDRCYARRILSHPCPDEPGILWYQFHLFREVRDPLSLTFYLRYKDEPIHKFFEMVKSHNSVMNGIEPFKELPLDESTSPTFSPETFSVQYLQDFGGLKTEWTDCLDDHLKIFPERNAIRIFAQSPFFYNGRDLQRKDYLGPIYAELSQTYALLFRPSSKKGLRQLHQANRFEDILENFYRCSLPPAIQAAFNIANPSSSIQGIGSFDQNKVTPTSMREIHTIAPYYPEDIKFMAFLRFEYFEPRLRRLKTYLDIQQPQTLKHLWTSWGSAFFCIIFLVLSAASAALLAIRA